MIPGLMKTAVTQVLNSRSFYFITRPPKPPQYHYLNNKLNSVRFGGGGGRVGGGNADMVVGSIDGPHEALGCIIYCFLVKFTDEKELVTNRLADGSTDRPSRRDAWTHLQNKLVTHGHVDQ